MSGIYSIECFTTVRGLGMGKYGPSIVLSEEAVAAFMAVKLTNKNLQTIVVQHISESVPKSHLGQALFYEDTAFLRSLTVGGQCACLGIDGGAISYLGTEAVRYHPHNIDSAEQSAVALSAWLVWFNLAISLTDIRMPYAT